MKRFLQTVMVSAAAIVLVAGSAFATPFASPSIGGPTGLISTPTAQVGWGGNNLAFDVGAHYIKDGAVKSTTPKVNVSLFQRLEIGACYDDQKPGSDNEDIIGHAKFRFFPWNGAGASALAIGGKWMDLQTAGVKYKQYQVYLAATYGGSFFSLPAETSIVIGKTWGDYTNKDEIDFSMGFDLDLFPSVFQGYIHWISDFSNYSYSGQPIGADSTYRGAFNTGVRIAILKSIPRFKLNLDILELDAFDKGRVWGAGLTFGMAL